MIFHGVALSMLSGGSMRTGDDATFVMPIPRRLASRLETDPWGEHLAATNPALKRSRWWAWVVPGMVMAVIGSVGLARPALWTDELQTWGMSVAPWHEMWPIMRYVDAVLAPYYTLTRGWTYLAGDSDIAVRVPSVAAMAGTAALIGALGGRLSGPKVGLFAGLVFAVLPASSRFAQEARPYALATFAATLATLLLSRALEWPSWRRMAGYAVAVALVGMMHEIAILVLAAHGWYVLAFYRRHLWRWLTAALLGALPLTPIVWFGIRQRHQVSYIQDVSFSLAEPFMRVVLGGVAIAVAFAVLALFALPLRRPTALFTAWALVPTGALLLVSLAVPMFLPRYLVFTLPAWALLAGTTIARLRLPWAATATAVVVALGISMQVTIRQPSGHEGQATREVADILTARASRSDGVVYATSEPGGGWTTRDLVAHYVPADHRPKDLLMTQPPRTNGLLLAQECTKVAACLGKPERVWVIRLGELDDSLAGLGPDKTEILRSRYRVEQVWRPDQLTLALLVRKPAAR
jgi:mannosyltransferase